MSESPRRRTRELVLKGLYAHEIEELDPERIVEEVISDDTLSQKNLDFARGLFGLVRKHRAWADEQITSLAKNWDIKRIADVDRIILEIALVELREISDSPVKVVLNEAIELAKKYSTGDSSSFINGILDAYIRKAEPTGPHS